MSTQYFESGLKRAHVTINRFRQVLSNNVLSRELDSNSRANISLAQAIFVPETHFMKHPSSLLPAIEAHIMPGSPLKYDW